MNNLITIIFALVLSLPVYSQISNQEFSSLIQDAIGTAQFDTIFAQSVKVDSCLIMIHSEVGGAASNQIVEHNSIKFYIAVLTGQDIVRPWPKTFEEVQLDTCFTPHLMNGLLVKEEDVYILILYYHCRHLIISFYFENSQTRFRIVNTRVTYPGLLISQI